MPEMSKQIYRFSLYLLCLLILMGCQTTKQGKGVNELLNQGGVSLGLIQSYEGVRRDFDNGRIMQARERALAMDKTHKDYKKVRKLLQEKIEPARQRLFTHYLNEAKRAEKNGFWHKAAQSYEQAKDVSLKPEEMEAKREQMELKVRQIRLNALLRQRRAEDEFLMRQVGAFEPPAGVSPADEVFLSQRERHEEDLEQRASQAYRDAWRYQRRGQPEVAYVDMESYLRLQPDSERGQKLMAEIRQAMPKQLIIPGVAGVSDVKKVEKPKPRPKKRRVSTEAVTEEQVRLAMKRGELQQAKRLALAYRREGGRGADTLLGQIQSAIKKQAAAEFAKGGEYFRQERLDKAIEHWRKAVSLAPEEPEYVEALRRARQLKERLTLLRSGGGDASSKTGK